MNLYSNPYCWTPQLGQSKVRINRLQIAIRGPFGMFCRTLCDFHEIYKSIFNSPLQFLEYFFCCTAKVLYLLTTTQLLFPWCSMVKINDLNDHWSKRSLLWSTAFLSIFNPMVTRRLATSPFLRTSPCSPHVLTQAPTSTQDILKNLFPPMGEGGLQPPSCFLQLWETLAGLVYGAMA